MKIYGDKSMCYILNVMVSGAQGGFEPPTRGFLFLSLKSKINS